MFSLPTGIVSQGMMNEGAPLSDAKAFYTVSLDEVFQTVKLKRRIDCLFLDGK